MQPILKQFQSYLKGLKSSSLSAKPLSPSSVKNYVSDANFFLTWLANQSQSAKPSQPNQPNPANQTNQTRQANQAHQANQTNQTRQANQAHQANQTNQNPIKPSQITPNKCQAYKNFLQENTPPATANRRLSSLRRFTTFLVTTKQLSTDPTQSLSNLKNTTFSTLLNQFETYLKSQNLTPSTIKNYLSDIKNYLLWARKNIKTTDGDLAPRS